MVNLFIFQFFLFLFEDMSIVLFKSIFFPPFPFSFLFLNTFIYYGLFFIVSRISENTPII
jgi:hypothetical protein